MMTNPSNKIQTLHKHTKDSSPCETSSQLEALKELIFDLPDSNLAKIEFFKDEISSGRYQIECRNIATKLVESVQSISEEAMICV